MQLLLTPNLLQKKKKIWMRHPGSTCINVKREMALFELFLTSYVHRSNQLNTTRKNNLFET